MPFLSEEIWHLIDNRKNDIIVANWPKKGKVDEIILTDFDIVCEVVSTIRKIRKEKQISHKEKLKLHIKENKKICRNMDPIICKLGNIENIEYVEKKSTSTYSFMIGANEYFIPLSDIINVDDEIQKLQKELDYNTGFLKSIENKLNNKKFVENAPENVVINEKNKMKDTKSKIEILTKKIRSFQN